MSKENESMLGRNLVGIFVDDLGKKSFIPGTVTRTDDGNFKFEGSGETDGKTFIDIISQPIKGVIWNSSEVALPDY